MACAPYGHVGNMHQHTCPSVAINVLCTKNPRNDLQDVRMDRHFCMLNAVGIYACQIKPNGLKTHIRVF